MCLKRCTKVVERTGYKVMIKNSDGTYHAIMNETKHIRGDWECAKPVSLTTSYKDGFKHYMGGFHIFRNKDGAINYASCPTLDYVLVKVKYRTILAEGYNSAYYNHKEYRCDVAYEMKIVEELGLIKDFRFKN